ncbi:MAG: hypothetical protein JWR83_3684, partial [Aeromicrobium sp.]|nr:hypothetical protein [Aeromicrobium sp.]
MTRRTMFWLMCGAAGILFALST